MTEGDYRDFRLVLLGESLCLICDFLRSTHSNLDLWIMTVYGAEETWVKFTSFQFATHGWIDESLVPLFCSNDGKLLFQSPPLSRHSDSITEDGIRINNDIVWFSSCDKRREWKKQHIKNVEKDLRETVNHELPMKSIPRPDDGFLCLTTKRDWYGTQTSPIDVWYDKKRAINRLNKGWRGLGLSKHVHTELLLPKSI
ncbi:hypothetical protein Tco_0462479 [Tanacetum coccineum]